MTGCLSWFFVLALLIFVMASMIRWFEQTAEAVDNRWWNKLTLLVLMPFSVWLFPSRISAGRPIPVALHAPVMGMGTAPKARDEPPVEAPVPKKPRAASGVDLKKLAKLKEKMRQQGMLRDDEPPT
jgi:hypothetical protein